ncbi:fimbrial protein, partial [Salmonella enterica subsp. enterica serovar Infantis]|nr:fimbrial protein [Salmonella enterica subsp. enterica serovar Infantis]
MKKTLMALAVAASALMSGQVMADVSWQQPGNLDQTVNFGGTITKPEYQNQWVWGVGAGFDSFQSSFTDLSEDKTELTFAAKENMP